MISQKRFDEMTQEETDAYNRYKRYYPQNRESWIGDILSTLDQISNRLEKLEMAKHKKGTTKRNGNGSKIK
jgi:hypothetical protein